MPAGRWIRSVRRGTRVAIPFSISRICLIRRIPDLHDPVLRQFSRSFYFTENNGVVDSIEVEIFNNSYTGAKKFSCDFFLGKPTPKGDDVQPKAQMLGTGKIDEIDGLMRRRVTLSGLKIAAPVYVTVQLKVGEIHGSISGGVYPPQEFFNRTD